MSKYTDDQVREWYREYEVLGTAVAVAKKYSIPLPTISYRFKKLGLAIDVSRSHETRTVEERIRYKPDYRERNREVLKAKELARYYAIKDTPEFKAKTRKYRDESKDVRRKYYRDNIDYFKAKAKEHYNPGAKHGISKEEYLAYMANACCGICGSTEKLKLDHNHVTGRIRGPLCHFCNVGIGSLKENPDILRKALCYIEEPQNSESFDPVI